MKHSLPNGYDDSACYLVPIRAVMIPIVAGALLDFLERRKWLDSDFQGGYQAISEVLSNMTRLCADELIESNRQVYRLLDRALNGTSYTVVTEDPLVIEPDIPLVPNSAINSPGLVYKADQIIQLVDNSINGTSTALYTATPSVKELLQGIIDKFTTDDATNQDLLDELIIIAGQLA